MTYSACGIKNIFLNYYKLLFSKAENQNDTGPSNQLLSKGLPPKRTHLAEAEAGAVEEHGINRTGSRHNFNVLPLSLAIRGGDEGLQKKWGCFSDTRGLQAQLLTLLLTSSLEKKINIYFLTI